MVFCIVALPILAILGIFSVRYRMLAKESFDCVFRTITFRKCHSQLDQRIKSRITGKILKYHPGTAKFIFKHFEILSWIFMILFIVSAVFSGIGIYNYVAYGNCNGPGSNAFCIFNPGAQPDALGNITQCSEPVNTYSSQNIAKENGSTS